jgi:hypothetical protein
MSHQLSFSVLAAMMFCVLTLAFASPARAVNCDVNACINACSKKCATAGCMCASNCMQTIEERKKAGQCKK